MNKQQQEPSSENHGHSVEMPYIPIAFLFGFIILANLLGQFAIEQMNDKNQNIKQLGQLVEQQKVSLMRFISSTSSSVIGLATSNWNLLLEERTQINFNMERYELLNEQILSTIGNKSPEDSVHRGLVALQDQWLELKGLSTAIFRNQSIELKNNDSLFDFMETSKNIISEHTKFERNLEKDIQQQEAEIAAMQHRIIFLNIGFQVLSIPLLVFFIFIPFRRKTRELEIIRIQQIALSKLSALGEMAGGIAHEINTPLGAILLSAEMIEMKNRKSPIPDEDISKRVRSIMATTDRASKIISGLRSFSRDSKNDGFQIFPVGNWINDTLDMCREKFRNHGIELIIEDDLFETSISGNSVQLSQVLINLLNNSCDSIQNNEKKWICIEGGLNGSLFELSVTDSGPGIAKEKAEKIFQPFYTTKGMGKGTGLGLSISKGILQNHQGDIFYDGTCLNARFVIRLPTAYQEMAVR